MDHGLVKQVCSTILLVSRDMDQQQYVNTKKSGTKGHQADQRDRSGYSLRPVDSEKGSVSRFPKGANGGLLR
jgi:hypothetical protein